MWMAPAVQGFCLSNARKFGGLHVSGLRKRRHVWPPAQMRSADRVHNKLTRLGRLQVYWVSQSRLSLSRHLPIQRRCHHDRQDPAGPARAVGLLSRHHCPDDPRHFVGQGDWSEFDRLASDTAPQPTLSEVLLTPRPACRGHSANDEEPADSAIAHLRDAAQPFFATTRVLTWHRAKPCREVSA